MVKIKYIEDTEGNKIFPVTHERAVRDNNGVTLETKLGIQSDLINQAQMEIGAVESDLVPTKNSAHWVTSGGVYSSQLIESSECFDISNSEVSSNDSTYITIDKTETGFTVECVKVGSSKYAYCTIPYLEVGRKYHVSFDFNLTGQSSASVPYNITVRTTADTSSVWLADAVLQNIGMSGSAEMEFTPTTMTTAFRVANNDIALVGGTMEITNISIVRSETTKAVSEINSNQIEAINNELSLNLYNLLPYSDCEVGSTGSRITIQKSNGEIVITGVSNTTGHYAYIKMPKGMVVGRSYRLSIEYVSNDSGQCPFVFTPFRDMNMGVNSVTDGLHLSGNNGLDLSSSYNYAWCDFTYMKDVECIRMNSSSMDVGKTCRITSLKLQATDCAFRIYDDEIRILSEGGDFSNSANVGTYIGTKIPSLQSIESHKFGYTKVMNSGGSSSSRQGCAAYNGYLFEFGNNNAYVNVYNLATSTFHSTVTPTNISTGHCNMVCFSEMFFDASDDFPLLYVSGGSTSDYHLCQVYRIQLESDVFTITQVQNLILPVPTEQNQLYSPNVLIDNKQGYGEQKGFLWLSCNRGNKGMYWAKFEVPAVVDGNGDAIAEATLYDTDMIEMFVTETESNRQGGLIINGICYLVSGVPNWGDTAYFIAIDMWGKKLINNRVSLSAMGWTYEPEGLGLYNGHLYCNTQGNGIYRFDF